MVPNLSPSEVVVTCGNCGAQWTVANPGLDDTITCGICGGKISLKEEPREEPAPAATATTHPAVAPDSPESRMAQAIRCVEEAKYQDAVKLYESVLAQRIDHRDAFYGLGYCHYRMGNYKDSLRLLRMASELGHPHVNKLIRRVEQRMRTPY